MLKLLKVINYADIAAFSGTLINFVSGTAFTWSSPEIDKIRNDTSIEHMSNEEASWISSLIILGQSIGPLIGGPMADLIGRKSTILIVPVLVAICSIAMAFGKVLVIFYVARFVTGFTLGGLGTVVPIYVAELASDSNRGLIGSFSNVFLCAGILFTYCVGPYLSIVLFNLILAVFPIIFFGIFYFLGSECPQYYVLKGKNELAKEALQKLRGPKVNTEDELVRIQQTIKEEGNGRFLDIFKSKRLTKAFFISFGLITFQQFSGSNVVLLYAQTIFQQAGSNLDPAICSMIVGAVMFLSSFITPTLVESRGRKFLLLVSATGMVISHVILGIYCYLQDHGHDLSSISFLPLLCLVLFIVTFNAGFGPLPWTITGELFPSKIKSIATSVSAGSSIMLGFLMAKYFPIVSDSIGLGFSFWIFAAICAATVPFTLLVVVETKGKSLEDIQHELKK